jgi:hypothetical protein
LTVADVKAPKKDTISAPENLAKARNEEVMNEMDKSQPSQERHGDYPLGSPTGTPAKPVEAKKVVKDLTKLLNKSFNKEEVENEAYEASNAPITTDTLAGRMPGGKSNSFKSFKIKVKPLAKEAGETETTDTNSAEKTSARASIKAEEVQVEATIAGTSGWEPMKKDVKDKSGAVHTPMSRAKDLARQAFKTVQNKTKVK